MLADLCEQKPDYFGLSVLMSLQDIDIERVLWLPFLSNHGMRLGLANLTGAVP